MKLVLPSCAFLALTVLKSSVVQADGNRLSERAGGLRKKINPSHDSRRRRMQTEPCVLLVKEIMLQNYTEIEEIDCYDPSTGTYSKIESESDGESQRRLLHKFHSGEIKSGQSTLMQEGAYFDDSSGSLVVSDIENVRINYGQNMPHRKLKSIGTKNMLVLRVNAVDSSTTTSETKLSDSWFGTDNDSLNLKSQYAACSQNKLICNASNTDKVSNGVFTVTISNSVMNYPSENVINPVLAAAQSELGNGFPGIDHVILCLPPGTSGSWIAYAWLDHYLSVYNDDWCNSVSTQMHEVGHNLGLEHSGQSAEYDDQTGMMGYSYSNNEAPRMCFNAPKNWQLGWYEDRQRVVENEWNGNLYGIADYQNTISSDLMIIQIPAANGDEWYVSFNRKKGINSQTVEYGNQVLVHKKTVFSNKSKLMAALNNFESYGDAPIYIQVGTISYENNAMGNIMSAQVKIAAPDPIPSPTSAPTPNPTPYPPTPSPTPGELFRTVNALAYTDAKGVRKSSLGDWVAGFDKTDYLTYDNLNFGPTGTTTSIRISYAKDSNGGKVLLKLGGATGTQIAEFEPVSTGGWSKFAEVEIPITNVEGHQTLTFVAAEANGIMSFKWFQLQG